MNPYLITVEPYVSLTEAYELLGKNHIRRLPVIDSHKELIGILTLKDIFEAKPSDIRHSLSAWKRSINRSQRLLWKLQ